jgi:hypothetical protein
LYCAYSSNVSVIDSIFWGNTASEGSQITVGAGYIADPRPATLSISYSNVQGGNTISSVRVASGSTLNWGVGNISADPGFQVHPNGLGNYYLNQSGPCISTGSVTSGSLGLDT